MATIWPGSTARAAGAVTCASTLPTATAMPSGSPVQRGRLGAEPPGTLAELADAVLDLVGDEPAEVGVERGQEVLGGVAAVLVDALVAGGARVADVVAGQLPDDPVGGLDPVLHGGVDLGSLLEDLQALGELPLGGDQPAVAGQPGLLALGGERVDPVGLRLGGVVAPELDVGVRVAGQAVELVQRGAVGGGGHHRAGGEVGADADDVGGVDAGPADGLGHRPAQHLDVVGGHLERELGRQRGAVRQRAVEDGVRVLQHGAGQLGAVADPHDDGAAGEGAVVDADHDGVGGGAGCGEVNEGAFRVGRRAFRRLV